MLDRHGVIVARTRDPDQYVGRQTTTPILQRIRAANEGVFEETTIEGKAAYIALSRVHSVGWTAAVAAPVEVIEGPMRRSMLAVASVGLLLLFMSGVGAFVFSRRLTRSIASAASAADALAHGSRRRVEAGRGAGDGAPRRGARALGRSPSAARARAR